LFHFDGETALAACVFEGDS